MVHPTSKNISSETQKSMQRPIVVQTQSDMDEEKKGEVTDILVGVVDKNTTPDGLNAELAAQQGKLALDKAYGANWHVVIGEDLCFDITSQEGNTVLVYYMGEIAMLAFKC